MVRLLLVVALPAFAWLGHEPPAAHAQQRPAAQNQRSTQRPAENRARSHVRTTPARDRARSARTAPRPGGQTVVSTEAARVLAASLRNDRSDRFQYEVRREWRSIDRSRVGWAIGSGYRVRHLRANDNAQQGGFFGSAFSALFGARSSSSSD